MSNIIRSYKHRGFWKWFMNHSDQYLHFENNQQSLFSQLHKHIRNIDPNLVFEFSPLLDGNREFIISCEGIKSSVESVQSLVAAAPVLAHWKVIAFRQRSHLKEWNLNDISLLQKDIHFSYKFNEHNLVDITLYVKGYTLGHRNDYGSLIFIILDHLLGEYDVMTKIGSIDIKPMEDINSDRLFTIDKLVELVDSRRS